jgi:uncharacterized protein (TIGR03435 family)
MCANRITAVVLCAMSIILLTIQGRVSCCQSKHEATNDLHYSVASIRRNPSSRPDHIRTEFTLNGLIMRGVTLHTLIEFAYGISYDQLTGEPGWVDTDYYDMQAKIDDSVSREDLENLKFDQKLRMLRQILVERFKLAVHFVDVECPVYDLVVAKDGPKLQSSDADKKGPLLLRRNGPGYLEADNMEMDVLASRLKSEGIVDRPVIDRTGLTGRYNITLRWLPDSMLGPAAQSVEASSQAPYGSSTIFRALQKQLGLQLVPAKGKIKNVVVDHVEPPTEN